MARTYRFKKGRAGRVSFVSFKKFSSPNLKIWGISATIGNLDEAEEVLFGYTHHSKNRVRITTKQHKKIKINSILPDETEEYPWAGHLGIKMAERWCLSLKNTIPPYYSPTREVKQNYGIRNLLTVAPQFIGQMAMHHSSINRETREWVEHALHEGKLKVVVCTASFDLGVDFRPVEAVIQVGSPKGVARFLQRAGRSGHRPGETSTIYFLPTHSMELLEASALREAIKNQEIESRQPYIRSFDVLAQFMVTLAVSEGFDPKILLEEVKTTHCYHSISDGEWQWLLTYITQGGKALYAYEEFKKVIVDEHGLFKVENKRVAMRHRLSIGTIVSDSSLSVKFISGGYIGTIEEYFISKLKPKENFWFAGRNLQLVKLRENTAYVKMATVKKAGKVPSWMEGECHSRRC